MKLNRDDSFVRSFFTNILTSIESSKQKCVINKSDNKIIDKLTLYTSDVLLAEY